MRICYVAVDVALPHFRGASTHVYEVSKNLAALGHEVHVVSRRVNFQQSSHEILEGVRIHRIYRGILAPLPFSSYEHLGDAQIKERSFTSRLYEWYLFNIFALFSGLVSARIAKKCSADVVLERETSFGAGAFASRLTNKPMILEIIGPRYSKASFRTARKVLAYNWAMIRDRSAKDKVVLVSAAADTSRFKPDPAAGKTVRNALRIEDAVVVGYVGTFAEWHGAEELIEASTTILKAHPNTRFLMVGPYYEKAKESVEHRGVGEAFIFTGPIPYAEVYRYMNAADVLVAPYNPSKSAIRQKFGIGSPLKVFEYMACEKPVITTAVEPITNVIRNRKTGVLVPAGDSKALAEATLELIENPALAQRIARAARREVKENYSWRSFAKRLAELIKEVLKN